MQRHHDRRFGLYLDIFNCPLSQLSGLNGLHKVACLIRIDQVKSPDLQGSRCFVIVDKDQIFGRKQAWQRVHSKLLLHDENLIMGWGPPVAYLICGGRPALSKQFRTVVCTCGFKTLKSENRLDCRLSSCILFTWNGSVPCDTVYCRAIAKYEHSGFNKSSHPCSNTRLLWLKKKQQQEANRNLFWTYSTIWPPYCTAQMKKINIIFEQWDASTTDPCCKRVLPRWQENATKTF